MMKKKSIKKSQATLDTVTAQLNVHDERFDRVEKQIDSLTLVVVDHSDRLERIENRLDSHDEKLDNLLVGQDKMIAILERVDQERVFTHEAVKRLEHEVARIKKHLHLI